MRPRSRHTNRSRQRGVALMVMLVIMIMGIAAVLVSSLGVTALKNEQQQRTADALAQAKDALIGYAASDGNRPGELPCPDVDGDGKLTMSVDYSGSNCVSLIGRVPWITLGIPELLDGDGEHLWYALSLPFHANGSNVLNSNTKGTLAVYHADGTTLLTESGYDAVAVIFSPGSPSGLQSRTTTAERNNAANYLDSVNGRNNASASGPFIAGIKSDSFNDQLVLITTKHLMPLLEQRVAGTVKRALDDYFTANGYYPWADNIAWGSDNYRANDGELRGWLPNDASAGGAPDWPFVGGAKSPPQWFFDNQWYAVIYYSVARKYTENSGGSNNTLTVGSANGVRTLFFMTGTPVNPQQRTTTTELSVLSNYLEDPENNDNNDDLYVTSTSQVADRDRLYWFSSSSIWNP